MKKILGTIFLVLILSMLCISGVNAHGVDVTADKMVIASDSDGQVVKDLADKKILISAFINSLPMMR